MRTRAGVLLAGAWIVAATPSPAQETIHRWKDEKGVPSFSNIAPPSQDGGSATTETLSPPPESGSPSQPSEEGSSAAVAAPTPSGPFGSLSADGFSSTVTRERLTLKRQLTTVKRELADATEALGREEKRKAVPTPRTQFDRIINGVTSAADGPPPDQEKALRDRKAAAEKRLEEIRKRFGELEAEANRRYGRLPDWWLPLE